MSTTASIASHSPAIARRHSLVADYRELFKLRVTLMVVITAAAGYYLACLKSGVSPFHMQFVNAMIGIAAVTCGSAALNQALERRTDAMMNRTRMRPMAAQRIGLAHGLILGFGTIIGGSVFLAFTTNFPTGYLTLLTAVGYVAFYTPLKRMTMAATFLGAFPGAVPPLIGWTAVRPNFEWEAVALFAILFVWQFPHFEAIGWLYREDYAKAGIKVTAVASPRGRATAAQALFYAVVMIPASLWPVWLHMTGVLYGVVASILGLGYLWYTLRFTKIVKPIPASESRAYARDLLRASVIYLPLLLAAMMLDANGHIHY